MHQTVNLSFMGEKPERKVSLAWFFQSLLVASLLAVAITALTYFFTDLNPSTVFSLLEVIAFVSALVHTVYRYRSWSFELREDHLYLEHGVLRKVYTMVPFVRVQHVDTQRNLVDRVLGLSQVVVYTAGSRGADVRLPGLKPGHAERLQEKLRDMAIESEDRDGV